ncbi:MAG: excinuclease ABC subunit UvrA [Polyangiaceae bacterium]|nr:excinuclease ABC subunit UvrA [Polyangiaceae bacterium]
MASTPAAPRRRPAATAAPRDPRPAAAAAAPRDPRPAAAAAPLDPRPAAAAAPRDPRPAAAAAPRDPRPAAAEPDFIEVRGAREHNLAVDELLVPKRKLVVFTGVSGSGKSSLAFDTLYAEGQRRYVESLSAYARQFLGQLERPQVEKLRGLSPTIAIEQKSASSNPRSTVGTITEVYDYLRVLFARLGEQHCHVCNQKVEPSSAERVARAIMALPEGTPVSLSAPLVAHRKGAQKELFDQLRERGFVRAMVDGKPHRLDAPPTLDKNKRHTIELLVDRVTVRPGEERRITDSVEACLREGGGEVRVRAGASDLEGRLFSEKRACCGLAFPELTPQSFSFNSPAGMCPDCQGLGKRAEPDPELIVPDPGLSIRGGAIAPWAAAMERGEGWTFRIADAVAKACGVNLDTPFRKLPAAKRQMVLYGVADKKISVSWGSKDSASQGTWGMKFEGVIPSLARRYRDTESEMAREHYARYFRERTCEACAGRRLRQESLAVRLSGASAADVTAMTVKRAAAFFADLRLEGARATVARGAVAEVTARLRFLLDVGLDYLTLDRPGPSLSGGEAQRIRLASQLGSELSGVMYVLDEPSIGLHPRDNLRLIETLVRLRDLGNTVLVVEHDEETIRAADHVVDFGPLAGTGGGHVLYSGPPEGLLEAEKSLTGAYLAGRTRIEVPRTRRPPRGHLEVRGAREHNLQNVDVAFPLGTLTAVTGVSGAGKSSLVNGILLPALTAKLHGEAARAPGAHGAVVGIERLDKCIAIDQQPIGRTPRSNPGTYTKAFDLIRHFFAELPEARARGFGAGRFSFNVKGGRCEACQGGGLVKVEMHFLADVYVTCEACAGRRYNEQTLSITFKGHSIADVLDLSVSAALKLFESHPALSRIVRTLDEVGLGYMKLGQTATTMSGGEAQRVKLSRELGRAQTGRTLYVLDEPTTGLHFHDVRKLLEVLQRLVDAGNSVVVIEHNLDVIKCADHVIDLGPEGGAGGGRVIAQGTPEEVARVAGSYTGACLRKPLGLA